MNSVDSIAVVISAHRVYSTLELCLSGFQSMLPKPESVIFVSNGRSEPLDDLLSRFQNITRIGLKENRLFCAGYNAGIQAAIDKGYEFVLLVNADTEVANPGFLGELLAAAGRRPKVAFLGPLVYLRSRGAVQNTCLHFPKVVRSLASWIPWRIAPEAFSRTSGREAEVDFLNGVCVLARVAALRQFGLMDETFGAYLEDADWSWRARQSGWSSLFVPVPGVVHHEEPLGYEHHSFKSFLLKRNTVLWFLKTGQRAPAWAYAGASLALARCRMMAAATRDETNRHRHFLRKLGRAYRGLLKGEQLGEWFGPPLVPAFQWELSSPGWAPTKAAASY